MRVDLRRAAALLATAMLLAGPSLAPAAQTNSLATARLDTNAFRVKAGFRIELVASEPMIAAPVALAFDENGRLFVVEMRGSKNPRDAKLGRVRVLENMNEDGVFQNSTIYAGGLPWPSAVACYAGGVFVAAAPDVLYLKDSKGDGVADARQVVLSGFGGTNVLDSAFLPNNFNWGPDNRIHGSSGGIGGDISGKPGTVLVSIAGNDFSFDPRTLEVFAEAGPSESGLCFDERGREFVNRFVLPVLTPMFEERYAARNPYYPRPSPLATIAEPAARIYRLGPGEMPRPGARPGTNVLNTVPVRSARGCVVYRGRAFPTNYLGNIFVAEPEAHVIHRLTVREDGLEISATRAPEEVASEFLLSNDPMFHPVQLVNGPDGALYIADVQDGNERGRIYRIVPEKLKRSKLPELGKARTYDLVSTLAQGDGWHRDTAARLLYERRDPAAPALLRGTLSRSRVASARVLALQALAGIGALGEQDVLIGLRDGEPEVRERAVALSEMLFKQGEAPDAVMGVLRGLAQDSSIRVRYQLAFTLGELQAPEKGILLGQILARDLGNPWIQNAVLSSVATGSGDLFAALAGEARFRNDAVGIAFLQQLANLIGVSGRQDAVTSTANFIARGPLSAVQVYALLYSLGDGLYRTRSSLSLVDPQGILKPFYSGALNLATDPTQPESARAAATQLLGVSTLGVGSVGDWLLLVCQPPTGVLLQSAAVETLSRYDDPQLVNGFLQLWPILAPAARVRAVSGLLSRDSQVMPLLDAIQSGNIPASLLSSPQRNFLRTHANPAIRQRAVQMFGPIAAAHPEVIQKFKPALSLRGDSGRGQTIFRLRCAGCHVPPGPAPENSLGPPLFRARNFTKDQLLSRIIEPSLAVRPDYRTQVVASKEGLSLFGVVLDTNPRTLTLRQSSGQPVVFPVSNLSAVEARNWSLMPDGLESGMSAQDMADLMEFVLNGMK